jgi:hypothetical protein
MTTEPQTGSQAISLPPPPMPAMFHDSIDPQSAALIAQSRAAVEARYILALRRPRNLMQVRQQLLGECKRPSFAEEATYAVERGQKWDPARGWVVNVVTGPSIRFAEAAMRAMTNLYAESYIVYDDERRRAVKVVVTDLESNTTHALDVVVMKTMERKKLWEGQNYISKRLNSQGDVTYLVEASEDAVEMKAAARISKAVRTLILRHVPGDIVDECERLCETIRAKKDAEDPASQLKAICDGFARVGVGPEQLLEYLGRPFEQATSGELGALRLLWVALRDGEANWRDELDLRREALAKGYVPIATRGPAEPAAAPPEPTEPAAEPVATKGAKGAAARAKRRQRQKPAEAATPPASPDPDPPADALPSWMEGGEPPKRW